MCAGPSAWHVLAHRFLPCLGSVLLTADLATPGQRQAWVPMSACDNLLPSSTSPGSVDDSESHRSRAHCGFLIRHHTLTTRCLLFKAVSFLWAKAVNFIWWCRQLFNARYINQYITFSNCGWKETRAVGFPPIPSSLTRWLQSPSSLSLLVVLWGDSIFHSDHHPAHYNKQNLTPELAGSWELTSEPLECFAR